MFELLKNIDTSKLLEKSKPMAVAAVCFLAVFLSGYGIGKSSGSDGGTAAKRSLNYTTTNTAPQNDNKNDATNPAPANTATQPTGNCYIKGSKSKTYHVPGGAFYERTAPAACFNSEEEAQAAGYKKSSR